MDKRQFLEIIYACRRRLNLAELLKKSVFALSIGAVAGILFQAAAFVVPFYYANLYTGTALFLAVAAALAASCIKRINAAQAALVMDGFGFDERIVTAYENLDKGGALIELQREDALRQLGAHRDRIHIPVMPPIKKILPLLGLLLVLTALTLMPSAMKERAGELHDLKEAAKEKEEEIEDVLEALEELAQEELTPEQQEAVQEMMEGLQSSLSEYQQVDTKELLSMAEQKLDYKYENMSSQLAQMLESGAEASAAAPSIQAVADELKQKSGKELAENSQNQKQDGSQNQSKDSSQSGGQNSKDSQSSAGGGGKSSQSSGSKDGQGSQGGEAGQGSNDSQGGQNGDGQKGQGDQSEGGQGGQSGQSSQNGSGEGGQSGSGEGDGQSSQGGDSEGGSGNGRGTGSSSTPRDYVSVPNAIADSGNLSGNAADHDASEYFRAQSGHSWEGMHISHEAVIGSYEQNAYEGIAAGRYPSGMEDVIKQYFSSFN